MRILERTFFTGISGRGIRGGVGAVNVVGLTGHTRPLVLDVAVVPDPHFEP